jgi:hypothetical protein
MDIRCASCGSGLESRSAFRMRLGSRAIWKCTRCSFIDRPLLVRSSGVAAVVGTILVGLNQGDQLLGGTFPWAAAWHKIVLTYVVPFCVATYGALSNGYRGAARQPGETG